MKNYKAIIFYGFKLPSEALEDDLTAYDYMTNDDGSMIEGLSRFIHGDIDDENHSTFIGIEKSMIKSSYDDDPISLSLTKFEIKSEWTDKLKKIVKDNNLSVGKIGWWVICQD